LKSHILKSHVEEVDEIDMITFFLK